MKWPPYLLKLRFQNNLHSFALWLPLFLIGPIVLVFLLAVFLIILPFAVLTILFTWRLGWWQPVLLSIPSVFYLLHNLSGLKVDVEDNDGHLYISFI
jgi:hypothetical protein